MRVCIDVQSAVSQRAGVGRYTRMLMENLVDLRGQDELSLFYFDFQRRGDVCCPPGASCRAVRWLPGRLAQQSWKRLHWPPYNWLAGRADVYHFPNFIIPPLRCGRAVVTIHDVSFLRHADFTEERNLQYLRARMNDTLQRAAAVITDSEFSAAELAELLPASRGKTTAIHPGIGGEFAPPPAAALAEWRERRGLRRPYLLTVGTLEPRKNHVFLMEIFDRLTEFDGELVVVGRRGWKYEPIVHRMRTARRAPDVRWLEDVGDEELPLLYAGAELLVFPSIYEGFGFPPLEAMACGTPALTSAGGSLREVMGEGAMVLDGYDPEEWTAAVMRLLTDSALRREFIERGRQQAGGYTWRETARRTWDVYREVAVAERKQCVGM